jgi:hypothetical protein
MNGADIIKQLVAMRNFELIKHLGHFDSREVTKIGPVQRRQKKNPQSDPVTIVQSQKPRGKEREIQSTHVRGVNVCV